MEEKRVNQNRLIPSELKEGPNMLKLTVLSSNILGLKTANFERKIVISFHRSQLQARGIL